jgi:hypothetical protein
VIISVVYVAIVLIISKIDANAAKVVSVALAALATGVFKKFETLRFQQLADTSYHSVEIPRLHWWAFILAAALCFFLTLFCPMAIVFFPLFLPIMLHHLNDSPSQVYGLLGADLLRATHSILANLLMLSGYLAANVLFGAICALCSPRRAAYTYAIFGALMAQAIPPLIVAIVFLMAGRHPPLATPLPIGGEFVPLACIAAAFFGAYFVSKRRERRAISGNSNATSTIV